jgi:hypothetical protein
MPPDLELRDWFAGQALAGLMSGIKASDVAICGGLEHLFRNAAVMERRRSEADRKES